MLQRVKEVQESDLRMSGSLARNIQRVIAVTQADIDAAAAQGKAWVVKPVVKVSDPLDNLRGGTQLVIKQNAILPGQNVMRVMYVGGTAVVVGPAVSPLSLTDAVADTLTYVKAFGGTEQRDIPDNYLQRQFIYMMDGSYLLTDIVPTFAGHYELDMQTTSVTGAAATYLGGRDESSGNGGLRFAHLTNKTFRIFGFGDYSTSPGVAADNTKYKFIWDNGSFWVYSGTTLIHSGTFTEETMPTTTPLAINGWNSGGTIGGNIEGIYLYSFKAWNAQGELVANYVPAVQKGTVPVVGFYDTVSKTFKTATAGTFAAGGEAVPTPDAPMDIVSNNGVLKARHQSGLPLGYTLLDYIESSGTQYIDTGITIGDYQRVNAKFGVFSDSAASSLRPFGSQNSAGDCTIVPWPYSVSGGYLPWGYCAAGRNWYIQGQNTPTNTTANTAYELDLVANNGVVSGTYCGQGISTTYTGTLNNGLSVALFANKRNDSYQKDSSAKVRIYYFKMWSSANTLAFDGVPVRDGNGVLGIYDKVTDTFFTNAGTGDFTAGTAVSDPVEIYTDGTVETINVHGKNLFDKNHLPERIYAYFANSGTSWLYAGSGYSLRFPCLPNTTYTARYNGNSTQTVLSFASTSNDTVPTSGQTNVTVTQAIRQNTPTINTPVTLTTGANDKWLIVQYNATDPQNTDMADNLQIEIGSTATTYEPYYNGGTATAEMLLKTGTYQDVQSIIDGAVTRSIGVKVLDGTENWTIIEGNTYYSLNRSTYFPDAVSGAGISGLSTHLVIDTGSGGTPDVGHAKFGASYFNCRVENTYTTLSAWTTFLADQYNAGTPVIVIYPLATPTTESVTGQTLQVTDGDNTLEITQASLNGLELEAEYLKDE